MREDRDVEAERRAVEQRDAPADDPGLLELLDAPPAGRGREAGAGGDLGHRQRAFPLQQVEDAPVEAVEHGTGCFFHIDYELRNDTFRIVAMHCNEFNHPARAQVTYLYGPLFAVEPQDPSNNAQTIPPAHAAAAFAPRRSPGFQLPGDVPRRRGAVDRTSTRARPRHRQPGDRARARARRPAPRCRSVESAPRPVRTCRSGCGTCC